MLVRSGELDAPAVEEEPAPRHIRDEICRTDTATLLTAMNAMDRGDYEAAGQVLRGPALVFEAVGTVYLAPGWQAQVHSEGHLLMTR